MNVSEPHFVVWRSTDARPWRVETYVRDGGNPRPATQLEVDGAPEYAEDVDTLFDVLGPADGKHVAAPAHVIRDALGWDTELTAPTDATT